MRGGEYRVFPSHPRQESSQTLVQASPSESDKSEERERTTNDQRRTTNDERRTTNDSLPYSVRLNSGTAAASVTAAKIER